ncbi:MAG: phosphoglucomutase/phosphomannomutase family protein [Acidobacteria bacterium]|nr:phosphoglucomutase/phosphomannomutase family protein [Acidobacteriota bacterium]
MQSTIKFGTSGWRGVIAEEFTLANVQRVVEAIARYTVSTASLRPTLLVGYDTRFLSERFAGFAAQMLAHHGVHCFLSEKAVPTPTVSFEIRRRKTNGGLNFTASHNPAEYNGIKFSMANGAPALPEVTRPIEAEIQAPSQVQFPVEPARVENVDLKPPYLDDLAQKVNLDSIRSAGLRLVYDALYGAGQGYLDGLLTKAGIEVFSIHNSRDVLFGGHPPDPAEEHLQPLRQAVTEKKAHLGLATDGDADRFGILDGDGAFISPNHILALLLDYLVESRRWTVNGGWNGGVAKSVATTHMLDAVANYHQLPVFETPVGFKYIGELIEQDKIILGGEESAGMSIRRHVPEKDGILACLLTAEMVAARRAPLAQQIQELFRKVGSYYPGRWNVPLTESLKTQFTQRSLQEYSSFQGRRVAKTDRTDGLKLVFDDGSWVLFRLSGTEPVCRLYCEAPTQKALEDLSASARQFLFG